MTQGMDVLGGGKKSSGGAPGRGSAKPFIAFFSLSIYSCSKENISLDSQRSNQAIIPSSICFPFLK